MPYSSSDYDTAVSAFNVLPESMAVENLIRLRQGNESGALGIDKMKRDAAKEEKESQQFDAFDEEYRKMGIAPDDYEGNAKVLAQLQMRNPGNKRIKEAADALTNASESTHKARKMKAESTAMDEWDANEPKRKELASLNMDNALSSGRLLSSQNKILQDDVDSNSVNNLYQLSGQISDDHHDLSVQLAGWGQHYGNDPDMASDVRQMGMMVEGLGKASNLEKYNKKIIDQIQPIINGLKGKGVNLSNDLSPEEIEIQYGNARNVAPEGSPEDKAIESAVKAHASLYQATSTRKALSDNLLKIASERLDMKDPATKDAFKVKMAEMNAHMRPLVGRIDKDWMDFSARQKEDELERERKKADLAASNTNSQIGDREGDSQLARQRFQQEKEEKANSAIKQIMIDFYKDPKNLTGSPEAISAKADKVRSAAEKTLKTSSTGFDKTRK